jgi:hypothetical protein
VRSGASGSLIVPCGGRSAGFDVTASRGEIERAAYSHSMVAGGLEVMSNTTRFTPRTSFAMRLAIRASSDSGSRVQSAVMPSSLFDRAQRDHRS